MLRVLLLQVRNDDDPMRPQEVAAFARVLRVEIERIATLDLLAEAPTGAQLKRTDLVLLGGSGHYSAAGEGRWLDRTLDTLQRLHAAAKPTFASCWGFQAFARALCGRVENDPQRAEVGTRPMRLTEAGRRDPVFAASGEQFDAQVGHEDSVVELPPGTTLLASSDLVENQAYRFDGLPIYCTQFHPELNRTDMLARVLTYPEYAERIAGLPAERFAELLRDTPQAEELLRRFVALVFG